MPKDADCTLFHAAEALDEDSSQAVVPDVHVFLGNDSLLRAEPEGNFKSDHPEPQCNFGLDTYAETLNRQSPDSARFTVYSDALINSTSRNDTTGFFARSFLFQNYQACIESRSDLTRVTSIGFTSQSANVSFCLEDLKLLPSQIPSAGELCRQQNSIAVGNRCTKYIYFKFDAVPAQYTVHTALP